MKRFSVLAGLSCLIPLLAAPMASAAKPNIVVILADDQGWGDLGIDGNTGIETPMIDGLAKAGAWFDRFYVSPVCSPTRAEFLTGRHHVRCGVYSTSEGGERVNLGETTIAEFFKRAGYQTAAFGKWHSGMQFPYHPNARGFDEFYGFCSGHWGDYYSPMLEHNNRIVKGDGFITNDLTNKAIDFIKAHRSSPFLVYLPYNTPHSPMQVPDQWWDEFKDKELTLPHRGQDKENVEHTRAALAMCENIDWNVGRLLQALDDMELAKDTIVVYFSDNGPNGQRWNGGMRGVKGSTDEGGVRSPLMIRWPGVIKPGTVIPNISSAMDLLPTLADLAGVDVAGGKPLDGMSLKPLLLGEKETIGDRMLFSHWSDKTSVRTQQYRLDYQGHLYDMVTDPGQWTDIADKEPAMAERLRDAVAAWRAEMLPGYINKDLPFTIGDPGSPFTQLPARDGVAHGNIQRSNRWPNCSFFTHWTALDDEITWNAEAGKSGAYRVDVYYTCPKGDEGATVELSFNGSSISGKVAEAWDPPLTGMENDRVERGESYVKDFKPMTLGTIRLEAGRGTLTIRATDIPGHQVMDLRMLYFTRVE